jgi:hypothetical protein
MRPIHIAMSYSYQNLFNNLHKIKTRVMRIDLLQKFNIIDTLTDMSTVKNYLMWQNNKILNTLQLLFLKLQYKL